MNKKAILSTLFACSVLGLSTLQVQAEESEPQFLAPIESNILSVPENFPSQFTYDNGVEIAYPADGVKGVFVTGHSAGGQRMNSLVDLMNNTALNAMVIDVKDDFGDLTTDLGTSNELLQEVTHNYYDVDEVMGTLEENEIYPIARIVVFKDTRLAEKRPDLSFKNPDGTVWKNRAGHAFVNPFSKEVWDYNIEVAKEAAKHGFKDIQFDYVRFPEGFELRDDELVYSQGEYENSDADNVQRRIEAVTDFVAYAREELKPFDVEVSVDIFGYAATQAEAPGIGQNFAKISENVDVISSMIYPSHWGNGYFGIPVPDLAPYEVVKEYIQVENEVLGALDTPPVSRPWLQDFTASYLGSGNYKVYGPREVEAQIRALSEHGVNEFLLWDAANTYTEGVNYMIGQE